MLLHQKVTNFNAYLTYKRLKVLFSAQKTRLRDALQPAGHCGGSDPGSGWHDQPCRASQGRLCRTARQARFNAHS